MKWYYSKGPTHTRVRVFMNGANCGELCFRNEEFQQIMKDCLSKRSPVSAFYNEEQDSSVVLDYNPNN